MEHTPATKFDVAAVREAAQITGLSPSRASRKPVNSFLDGTGGE